VIVIPFNSWWPQHLPIFHDILRGLGCVATDAEVQRLVALAAYMQEGA